MVGLSNTLPLPSSFRSCEVGAARRVSRNLSEASRATKHRVAPSVIEQSQMEAGMPWDIVGKIGVSDTQACPERVVTFIRRLHPAKTAEHVSADTGVSADTVRKWIEGVAKPSFVAFSKLILAYGPAFLIAVYPKAPKWLDDAHRRERIAALEEQQARIRAEIAELV